MLIIKKSLFFIFVVLAGAIIIFFAIEGFYLISTLNIGGDSTVKYYAEQFIYLGIIFVLIVLFFSTVVYRKSRDLFKELDMIGELSQESMTFTSKYLSKLGKLGGKIHSLYANLIRLNDMKSLKISTISNMNTLLIENIDWSLLVINIQGKIIECSKKLLLKIEADKQRILKSNITELITPLNWSELVSELEKQRSMIVKKEVTFTETKKYSGDCVFYPVFNAKDQLALVIAIVEHDSIVEKLSKKADQIPKKEIKNKFKFFNYIKEKFH